jgi:dipeptidyl aminopeptidase/acylaminoacyl peptidase
VVAALAAVSLACTPHAGLGTISYRRGSVTHVVELATCRERLVNRPETKASRTLISPDGRYRATVRRSGRGKTLRDTIVVNGRPIYAAKVSGDTYGLESRGPIELLSWSGDDRWIFFAIDPGSSASIAADGLILRVVSSSGGSAHPVAQMLAYRDYLTWCGGRLVFTAGGDRIATNNKRLLVAVPPDWRAQPLVSAPGRAWGALVCAPGGRSVVVQSQEQSDNASFFATRWALWRVGLDGSRTQLTSPPAHYADESPRFSRDGKTILFVRSRHAHGQLYALRDGRVIGPLVSLSSHLGYYGHQDWWATMNWSLEIKQ